VVEDVKAEVRFASPVDWKFEDEDSHHKQLNRGWKDSWNLNKLAYGDFFVIDVYARVGVYVIPDNETSYHPASITLTLSGKEPFWTIDESEPFNREKYREGLTCTISDSVSTTGWVHLGTTPVFRVKSPKDAGVKEGECRDAVVDVKVSWSNGADSDTFTIPLGVRLAWIKPEVRQVWLTPFSCAIKVYGYWCDDSSLVKGRPYLYYGVDVEGKKRISFKNGMTKDGVSYSISDPIDPKTLRPVGYNVNGRFTIDITPIEDFGLMKTTVEYRELALSVHQRDESGFKLRVFEFYNGWTPVPNARVTLVVKDLSTGKVVEIGRDADPQGFVSFARGELKLPSNYEVWAYAWGRESVGIIYARGPFGGILLERSPVAP
jgi:hypothetical protein